MCRGLGQDLDQEWGRWMCRGRDEMFTWEMSRRGIGMVSLLPLD